MLSILMTAEYLEKYFGEKDKGFELMNVWLEATRLTVAATSVSRAERAFNIALDWSANRKQFEK